MLIKTVEFKKSSTKKGKVPPDSTSAVHVVLGHVGS